MTHLGANRDRGENQPITMEDARGTKYRVRFDESLSLERPVYEEVDDGGTTRIRIQARTMREARTILGRVKAKHNEFDIDEAMKQAVVARDWPEGALKSSFEIGPRRTFPGIFAAATLFAATKGLKHHPLFRSFIDGFNLEEPAAPPDTFYFYLPEGTATSSGEVTHKIVMISDLQRQQSLVWISLFGIVQVAVLHPYEGSDIRSESYGVDILAGAEVTVDFDQSAILEKQWVPSHALGSDFWSLVTPRIDRIIGIAQRRASEALIERHSEEVLANLPHPLTGAGLLDALRPVVEFTTLEMRRPGLTEGDVQQKLAIFQNLLTGLSQLLPAAERSTFDAGAKKLIAQVAASRAAP